MRWLKCLFLVAALLPLSVVASTFWAEWASVDPATVRADAILVLGAGMDADGTLHRSTRARVETGVALFEAGAAPLIVFTGGAAVSGGPNAGAQMTQLAGALGVPEDAMRHEGRALSTLQNARFTRPVLDRAGVSEVVLVTEGFHIPRSRLSLAWAGIRVRAHVSSGAFREDGAARMIARETLAWPYNLARVGLWHILGWAGQTNDTRDAILADAAINRGPFGLASAQS